MEKMEHHNSHQEEKSKSFSEQQPIFENIYKNGFSKYIGELENFKEAFVSGERCVYCIDEGTPGDKEWEGVHSAGSGILRDQKEVIEEFKQAGIKEITSHEGCGAAGIAYANAKKMGKEVPESADEYGKQWAKEVANGVGATYRHITSAEMKRPKDFHFARVVYYDGVGGFDYSKLKDLPPGFEVSRSTQGESVSLAEVELSFKIAVGDHGFGNLIDKNHPFVFVAIGKDKEQMLSLMYELRKTMMDVGDRAKIDGFVVPVQEK